MNLTWSATLISRRTFPIGVLRWDETPGLLNVSLQQRAAELQTALFGSLLNRVSVCMTMKHSTLEVEVKMSAWNNVTYREPWAIALVKILNYVNSCCSLSLHNPFELLISCFGALFLPIMSTSNSSSAWLLAHLHLHCSNIQMLIHLSRRCWISWESNLVTTSIGDANLLRGTISERLQRRIYIARRRDNMSELWSAYQISQCSSQACCPHLDRSLEEHIRKDCIVGTLQVLISSIPFWPILSIEHTVQVFSGKVSGTKTLQKQWYIIVNPIRSYFCL